MCVLVHLSATACPDNLGFVNIGGEIPVKHVPGFEVCTCGGVIFCLTFFSFCFQIQAGPLLNSEKPNLAELHEILNYWQTLLTCLQVNQ